MSFAEEIGKRAEAFIAAEIAPHQAKWEAESGISKEIWLKAGELGLISPDVPKAHGGAGGDFRAFSAILEARARQDDRSWGVSNQAIVINYILHHGTDVQREKYLARLLSGRLIGAIAMTEPSAGSDLKAIQARVRRVDGGYVLSGRKSFISNVRDAGLIIVAAKTDGNAGVRGISLMLVDVPAKGFEIVRHLPKVGQRGLDTSEIDFADVALGEDALLGGVEGFGFAQLMEELPYERMIVAVTAIATMERALAIASDYAKTRSAFGKKLIELQHIRFKLAEMKAQCTVGRAFVETCIERLIKGELDAATASTAKLWLTEAEFGIVDECVQIFGGNGYISDYPIAQIFIDARVDRIYGGTSEIMKEIIARTV
jgi:acyl-CoA dehydrogenase